MRWICAITALALSACSGALGDFCHIDDDCRAGLRCAHTGGRGVCVVPTSAPSSAVPDIGLSPADSRADQRGGDARGDSGNADAFDAGTPRDGQRDGGRDGPVDSAADGPDDGGDASP